MNDCLSTIVRHRSIRRFRSTPIADSDLDAILHAAERASSSGNMQTYSIIVTTDAARRAALWELHGRQDMIKQAPVLLTFCVDWHRMNRWCRLSETEPGYGNVLSFLVGFADALIAAQNAALAAESLGLGICYMGTTLCAIERLTPFFALPPDVVPATTLVIGHPDEDPALRARLPQSGIVHRETYEAPDDARIREIYASRETEGWDRYMSIPALAQAIETSGVRNLAQVYTQLKYTRENNEAFSDQILRTLHRQGFLAGSSDDQPTGG